MQQVAGAQFVLLGESHYDHDTPLFAAALYRELNSELGFHHLVVEQDSVGIEDSLAAGTRGDAAAIAKIARGDAYLLGFSSDQDLQLLADVGRLEKNADPIWGLEQTQGTTRYLRELAALAPSSGLRAECENLLAAAAKIEAHRGPHGNYLSDDPAAYAQMLRALRPYQKLFRAKVAEKDQWEFRAFVNGYDAVVLLPGSRKADMKLTGFPNPF